MRGSAGKSKKSKASMLHHSADYCRRMMTEYNAMLAEADALRAEIQALSSDINQVHEALPADGVGQMTPSSGIPIEQMFRTYVQTQSLSNWKFWIFGRLARPVFDSFNRAVSISNPNTFCHSTMHWVRDYMSLVALRPVLLEGLRDIVTSTSIMKNPEQLPHEVRMTVLYESGLITPMTTVAMDNSRISMPTSGPASPSMAPTSTNSPISMDTKAAMQPFPMMTDAGVPSVAKLANGNVQFVNRRR